MKLKLVVASMSVLGLVSCPLYAATTTKHHHKPHYKHVTKHHSIKPPIVKHHTGKHHVIKHHEVRHKIFTRHVVATQTIRHDAQSDENLAEANNSQQNWPQQQRVEQIAPEARINYKGEIARVCAASSSEMILESATQNEGRALPNPCEPGWYNRIRMSGGINLDMGKWGNRDSNFEGVNYKRISINDAYLNVDASVTNWINAFTSLSYSDPSFNHDFVVGYYTPHYWTHSYSNVYKVDHLSLEQGYVTVGDFEQNPFYLQFGKEFLDFGRYEIHPITASMTQVMSETLNTTLKVGAILPSGFNASIYAFSDTLRRDHAGGKTPYNYGFSAGYDQTGETLGWNVGGGYLHNIIAANDITRAVEMYSLHDYYHRRVGGIALYGDVNTGAFNLSARWVSTIQRFSEHDLPQDGIADLSFTSAVLPGATGAKPWAASINGGYNFTVYNRDNNIYVGYQTSREAAGIGLPKYRYLAGWDVEVWRSSHFGIEWDHDRQYQRSQGGLNKTTNLFSLRAGVQFD
jgi:hypothetical protein